MILQDCDRCDLYTVEGRYHASARVCHKDNIVKLYFDDYHLKDTRTDYMAVFYDKKEGELHILCQLVVRRNPDFPQVSEPWMADCRLQHLIKAVKPEKNAKVRVYAEATFRMDGGRTFYGTIKEMDTEGMFITSFQPLNKNQHITISDQFQLRGKLEAEAVRVKRMKDGSYGYECRFVNVTAADYQALQEYVNAKTMDRSIRKN